jgi:hypothetical protein
MGLRAQVSNARGIRLLWILLGCNRKDKHLRPSLILLRTVRRMKMVLRVVDKLLALLNAA